MISSSLIDLLNCDDGQGIRDEISGCRLQWGLPDPASDRWWEYLAGAREVYRSFGVTAALDFADVASGRGTSAYCAVVDGAGVVRGGLRIQGPHSACTDTHALIEWEGCPGRDQLIAAVNARIAEGVVEVKTAWVDPRSPHQSAIAAQLARTALPIFRMTGARHAMATAADHALRRWVSAGGRVDPTVEPAPYPDHRYRTALMWWDAQTIDEDADPDVLALMRREAAGIDDVVATRGARIPV